jgi:hypothetical protein
MDKIQAINLVAKATGLNLSGSNTIFANVGINKDSWWLEPSLDRLVHGFYFILDDSPNDRLLLFRIPPNSLPKTAYRQRDEKGAAQIIIPLSKSKYLEKKGFDYTPFLKNTISYK